MIIAADAEQARREHRRPARGGWNTAFIGANRYTRTETDPLPDPDAVYPMAFLVEKQPGAVVRPHYHQANQFQVVVAGGGSLGTHDVAPGAVHYTDRYSAYGPILAGEDGIAWFTLRNAWDPGARYMPADRQELRAARIRHQHREATLGAAHPMNALALAALRAPTVATVLEQGADGLGAWRYRLPDGASVRGPDPGAGGGQYWIVFAGTAVFGGDGAPNPRANWEPGAPLGVNSCAFVSPDGAALALTAGPGGAEVLALQFPRARPL